MSDLKKMRFTRNVFMALTLLFALHPFSFVFLHNRIARMLWQDQPAWAFISLVIALLMGVGWWVTVKKIRALRRQIQQPG